MFHLYRVETERGKDDSSDVHRKSSKTRYGILGHEFDKRLESNAIFSH
jgi:hypothetical protein